MKESKLNRDWHHEHRMPTDEQWNKGWNGTLIMPNPVSKHKGRNS